MDKITNFQKKVEILENLPTVISEINEIKALASVEDPILSAEWSLIDRLVDNQFILNADEYGISRYEKMLKLKVPASDSLETRIFRVLSLYQSKAPYTFKVLDSILKDLLGEGKYTLERNVETKVLTVRLELVIAQQISILRDTLERIVPANMILELLLRYNTWRYISQFRWGQLTEYTWRQVKEDELNPPPYVIPDSLADFTHLVLEDSTHQELQARKQG